ncbi:hypothetical protein ACLK10_20165 [Escherichia coli]
MPNWSSKKPPRSAASPRNWIRIRQGERTGIQLILSGEESQRGQRLQAYFGLSQPGATRNDCPVEANA